MRIRPSFILDLILFIMFSFFVFTAMEIMPSIWTVLRLILKEEMRHLTDIFIAIPFIILLFYTIFVKRQKHFLSYVWYIILIVLVYVLYNSIESPYNRMHIFQYFLLSILVFRIMHHFIYDIRLYILGVLIAGCFGIVDETTQYFVPTRVASLADLGADFISAGLGQMFIFLVVRPELEIGRFKLRKQIKGYYAQERWLKKRR